MSLKVIPVAVTTVVAETKAVATKAVEIRAVEIRAVEIRAVAIKVAVVLVEPVVGQVMVVVVMVPVMEVVVETDQETALAVVAVVEITKTIWKIFAPSIQTYRFAKNPVTVVPAAINRQSVMAMPSSVLKRTSSGRLTAICRKNRMMMPTNSVRVSLVAVAIL